MSRSRSTSLSCPGCQSPVSVELYGSINVDRAPALRDAVLDGSLQSARCEGCSASFRAPPELSYQDLERGQWIAVLPLEEFHKSWREAEARMQGLYDTAFGGAAPAAAQEIGAGLSPRLVFGWAGLREKLVARDAGLDDTQLELLKLSVIRQTGTMPKAGVELRLARANAQELELAWIEAELERFTEGARVPRAQYDTIVADPEGWKALREQLDGTLFRDIARLFYD